MDKRYSVLQKLIKPSILIFYLFAFFLFSLYIANFTWNTDFPVFYSTAKTVLTEGIIDNSIYEIDYNNRHEIPEPNKDLTFIYSKAAALCLAPIGLLPYYYAKAVMIYLNILAFMGGTFFILQLSNITGRKFFYLWCASFFWLPFIQVIRFGQVDGLIFFLITGALWFAQHQRPYLAGALIGGAMLFKIFPLALAMVFGLKNRRILEACLLVFGLSLLIPGALDWFFAIPGIYHRAYSIIYTTLKLQGLWLYALYCLTLGGAIAFLTYRYKSIDYIGITALSLPVIYLTMPIVEYYHLTSLIISIIYIFSSFSSIPNWIKFCLILPIISISLSIKVEISAFTYFGIFSLFIPLAYINYKNLKNKISSDFCF